MLLHRYTQLVAALVVVPVELVVLSPGMAYGRLGDGT